MLLNNPCFLFRISHWKKPYVICQLSFHGKKAGIWCVYPHDELQIACPFMTVDSGRIWMIFWRPCLQSKRIKVMHIFNKTYCNIQHHRKFSVGSRKCIQWKDTSIRVYENFKQKLNQNNENGCNLGHWALQSGRYWPMF